MMLFWLIFVGSLMFALACLALLRLALRVVIVRGQSMLPALAANDRVLAWRFWPTGWLCHGQIVLVCPWGHADDDSSLFIKRIVALPGETLVTSINELPEHLRSSHTDCYDAQGHRKWQVPHGHIFVRGDNPKGSVDSTSWGAIPSRYVYGIVFRKLSHPYERQKPTTLRQGPPIGYPAPPFRAETLEGEVRTLMSYNRCPVVFLFISPCRLCREVIPDYEMLALKAAQSEITFVLISDADTASTRTFLNELDTTLPLLVAPRQSNPFLRDYRITVFPWFCLIDAQGLVQATGFPTLGGEAWKDLVETWEGLEARKVGEVTN